MRIGPVCVRVRVWERDTHSLCRDQITRMGGFGDLPIRPRKRQVFVFECRDGPVDCPMVIDPSGLYVRREGRGCRFVTGRSPTEEEGDPDVEDGQELHVDHDHFEQVLWPLLAERVPAFAGLKVGSARGGREHTCTLTPSTTRHTVQVVNSWAGLYEYNTVDQNAIIGKHPATDNMFVLGGFSGHGIQQSPAAGRAIAELVTSGSFQTIDLSEFSVERVLEGRPLREKNIV